MHTTCILQIVSQGSFHSFGWLRGFFIQDSLIFLTVFFLKKKKKRLWLINSRTFFFSLSFLDFPPQSHFSLSFKGPTHSKNPLDGFRTPLDCSTFAFCCVIKSYWRGRFTWIWHYSKKIVLLPSAHSLFPCTVNCVFSAEWALQIWKRLLHAVHMSWWRRGLHPACMTSMLSGNMRANSNSQGAILPQFCLF